MTTKRKMVHVYVTPDEKELIEHKAGEKGLSVSKWLLYLALNANKSTPTGNKVVIKKPDRTLDTPVNIPSPPEDGVQRGFKLHPSKPAGGRTR